VARYGNYILPKLSELSNLGGNLSANVHFETQKKTTLHSKRKVLAAIVPFLRFIGDRGFTDDSC
jgi:hypothetical protein